MASFLHREKALLTVMLQCETPQLAIGRMRNAHCLGAEAFGLQAESLKEEFQTPEFFRAIVAETKGKPLYVTNYRGKSNKGKSDDTLAKELLTLADCGATLVDVMGDFFAPHPEELCEDTAAIEKQKALIDSLHQKGCEVLMSSHIRKFTPAEKVLEMAREQIRRGADISKIVVKGNDMAQQIENLRITNLLKEELGAPFLFLSGGTCSIHRRLGGHLGNCMTLCVYEHDDLSTAAQPLLTTVKTIRDTLDF